MTQSRLSLIRTLHILVLDTEHKDNADRTVLNGTALTRHFRHSTWTPSLAVPGQCALARVNPFVEICLKASFPIT